MLKRVVGTFLILTSWSLVSHASNLFSEGDFVSVPGLEGIEVQKHELTYGQYQALNPALPAENRSPWDADDCYYYSKYPAKAYGTNFPAVCVSWDDAQAYIAALNIKPNKEYNYRLPTDAELGMLVEMTLESLKAGAASVSDSALQSHAWYWANSGRETKIHEVCTKQKVHGLCDVLGNLWEWTSTSTNRGSIFHFLRGGSWSASAGVLRAASRGWAREGDRHSSTGFRLVRTPKE